MNKIYELVAAASAAASIVYSISCWVLNDGASALPAVIGVIQAAACLAASRMELV